jgi:hypothetical protein
MTWLGDSEKSVFQVILTLFCRKFVTCGSKSYNWSKLRRRHPADKFEPVVRCKCHPAQPTNPSSRALTRDLKKALSSNLAVAFDQGFLFG